MTRALARPLRRARMWGAGLARRARLREVTVRHVLEHGTAGFTLDSLFTLMGSERGTMRHYYRDIGALFADIAREHKDAIGERMTEAVLAARALAGPARVEALASALLDALDARRDEHRFTTMAVAGLPFVAHATRNADRWLHGVFGDAIRGAIGGAEDECALRARSLLTLIEGWALRLEEADAETRAACARLVTRMVMESGSNEPIR